MFATFSVGIAASRFKYVLIFTKNISQNLLRAGTLVHMLVINACSDIHKEERKCTQHVPATRLTKLLTSFRTMAK